MNDQNRFPRFVESEHEGLLMVKMHSLKVTFDRSISEVTCNDPFLQQSFWCDLTILCNKIKTK